MASIATSQWAGVSSPQCRFNVWQTAENGNTVTFGWSVEYVAHGYAAYTNGAARNFWATIDGVQVVNQNYNINGVSSTVQIASGTATVFKHNYWRNISIACAFYFDVTWSGYYAGSLSASGSISIAPKTSYAVKYNANGGTGAPGNQTKWYGDTLKLSSTKPTRTGYTFQGWATSASGSVAYQPGANYTSNAAVTLYAVWKANTFTVKYDANGGTGAPGNQTKTYGVTLKLSTTKPTRSKYNFLGWGTSASSTTVAYAPGANYTANTAITLYAIWELAYTDPLIENLEVYRCDPEGAASDEGNYIRIRCSWKRDPTYTEKNPIVGYNLVEVGGNYESVDQTDLTGSSGTIDVISSKTYDPEKETTGYVMFLAGYDSVYKYFNISPKYYTMDFLSGGKGVAFGKPASEEGFDVNMNAYFRNEVSFEDLLRFKYTAKMISEQTGKAFLDFTGSGRARIADHIGLANSIWLQGQLASGAFTNILRMNEDDQVELNWTTGGLKGRVMKEIWSGTLSKGASVSISELPYYSFFLISMSTVTDEAMLAWKSEAGRSSGTIHGVLILNVGSGQLYVNNIKATYSGTSFRYIRHMSSYNFGTPSDSTASVSKIIGII